MAKVKSRKQKYNSKYKILGNIHPRRFSFVKVFITFFIFLVIGAVFIFLFSSLLQINIIEVQGAQTITPEDVIDHLSLTTKDHLLFVNTDRIAEDLKRSLPLLESVEVSKQYFPNKLIVTLQERRPVLSWHTGSGIYRVDREGIVLGFDLDGVLPIVYAFGAAPVLEDIASETDAENEPVVEDPSSQSDEMVEPATIPTLDAGDKVADAQFIEYILDIYSNLSGVIGRDVVHIEQGEAEDLAAVLSDNLKVYFSTQFTLASEIDRLQSTLQEAQQQNKTINEYIDLRFKKKVYFK